LIKNNGGADAMFVNTRLSTTAFASPLIYENTNDIHRYHLTMMTNYNVKDLLS